MTKTRKVIGKVSVPRGEFIEGMTYYRYNVVTYLGSAFMCTVDSTTVAPATLQDDGETVVLNKGWIFFADATAARSVGTQVVSLERDLGQYEPLPSVAMTAETTGKYINAEGVFVDDADFNIAAIGAVVVGNTYELYMGGSDKMKQGVALFVARIKTTTTSGTERVEYLPLFSAMSTDIAKSGYVCFEAMEAYSDVLVCYRADVPEATTLLVRRYGTKASIATQINNLKKKVDLKSFADGYYASMRVGSADNLTSKGEATEELIMSRKAGGNNQIEDGSASIKRIKGYSVVMNQSFNKAKPTPTGSSKFEFVGEKLKYTPITTPASVGSTLWLSGWAKLSDKVIRGHVYLYDMLYTRISEREDVGDFEPTQAVVILKDKPTNYFSPEYGKTIRVSYVEKCNIDTCAVSMNDCIITLENVQLIDLTQMFGSGNEPTTPDDFAKRLGYDSIDDVPYIPYNEGEIVSSFAEGINTTDTEGKVSERKWSETLKKYFPDGLKSAGSAYDEITPTKAVKRIRTLVIDENAQVELLTESDSSIKFKIRTKDYLCGNREEGFVPAPFFYKVNGGYYYDVWAAGFANERDLWVCVPKSVASNRSELLAYFKKLKDEGRPLTVIYQLKDEQYEEITYDELNLTEQVAEGGTEEAIITDGKTSTPLRADIVYPIDAYNTIKANKANIGTLSSLNTVSKTDLVSAINELVGKVGSAADDVASLQSGLSSVETAAATNRADLDRTMSQVASPDDRALPLLCGQPPILFGAGTPKESIVPDNWSQYDPATGEGYNWNGKPSAIGQQYVDTTAASGGRYIAARDGEWDLKWINS